MGDVIPFRRPPTVKPLKSEDLTYPTPRDVQAAQDIIVAVAMRGDCIAKGATECQSPQCGLSEDGA